MTHHDVILVAFVIWMLMLLCHPRTMSSCHASVHHMDLYRLYAAQQLSVLRLPLVIAHDVVLMEWSDRLLTLGNWPEQRLDVILQDVSNDQYETELSAAEDGEDRTVTLVSHGDVWFHLLQHMNQDQTSKISNFVLETQTIPSQVIK